VGFDEGEGDAGRDDAVGAGELVREGSVPCEPGERSQGGGARGERLTKDLVDEKSKGGEEGDERGRKGAVEGKGQRPRNGRHGGRSEKLSCLKKDRPANDGR